MIDFWLAAGLLLLIALSFLLIPVLRGRRAQREEDRTALNVALYQERVAELQVQQDEGVLNAAQLDTGPPEPTPTLDSEDSSLPAEPGSPQKPGEADQSKNWINIFSPADPTHVSTPSDAGAEVMKDDTGQFLRIRSGASGSAIAFDVGQGVLEKLAGKHAMFDVVARSEEGKETQISVDCNFGDLGDCGRKRYAVGHERNEYLFDVQFPDKHPGAAGTIAVNSDFDQQGKSVDIYEIRVSIAQ